MPAVAALHPVNGFAILLVTLVIARLAWVVRLEGAPAGAREPAAADGGLAATPGGG
jgi:hypothetical protein